MHRFYAEGKQIQTRLLIQYYIFIYLVTISLHAFSVCGAAAYARVKTSECRRGNQSKFPRDAI